jgi:hypothetical protein
MAISNKSGSAMVDALLDALHPSGTNTAVVGTKTIQGPIRVRFMTANGSDTANGTELSTGGSYTAGSGVSIDSNWAASSAKTKATNATIQQTNMPASTIVGIELWDSTGTPQRIDWGSMTSKTTQAGDTLSFSSAAISVAIT